MEDLLRGRSFQRVARPVVKERKLVSVLAPTHPPKETGRTARENIQKGRDVKWDHAEVWRALHRNNSFLDLVYKQLHCYRIKCKSHHKDHARVKEN